MQRKLNTKVVMLIMLIITILTITKTVLFLKNKGEERRESLALEVTEGPKVASIQGSTITRIIEGEPKKVKEQRDLGWNYMDFNIKEISAKITGDKKFIRYEDICKEIVDETDRVTGNSKNVSTLPINCRLYGPTLIPLTLVDLPGLVKNVLPG